VLEGTRSITLLSSDGRVFGFSCFSCSIDKNLKVDYTSPSPKCSHHALEKNKIIPMPNLANAKKALRQNLARAARRQPIIEEIHSSRRHFRKLLEAGKIEEAKAIMPKLDQMLDKAVTKNIFKLNKAARVKSRLMASLQRATQK